MLFLHKYRDIYTDFGAILSLNEDWNVRDFIVLQNFMKPIIDIKEKKQVIIQVKRKS